MRAIHRKLLRDLWQIKGQGLAISLVIGAGVAMFIMYLSTFESLRLTQEAYYERYRFADVFVSLKRAPLWLEDRIEQIPGVAEVDTRVVASVTLDVEDLNEPVLGRLISIPERDRLTLNDVALQKGRYIEPGRSDEVLVSEGFALARGLEPGDSVAAILNGRHRELEIVGIALSPEYVYNIRPGEMIPDEGRFGLFWMGREALATAFDMEGGFNDVALTLMRGASEADVIARLDRLLETYGGLGAIPRSLQLSHWYLDSELVALQSVGLVIPIIFLAVAAFLLNVVLTRIIAVQREQIAALKALGYSSWEVGLHYIQWGMVIAAVGGAVGAVGGGWLGSGMISIYNQYFRFPFLEYRLSSDVALGAVLISFAASVLGAFGAVRKAVRLPPAEAMRPEAPASYRQSWFERAGFTSWLSQPARMVLRNLKRRPGRALASVVGIAFASAMLIVGLFFIDAMDELMFIQFNVAQRHDVTVTFVEPASSRALHEIGRLPGVIRSESLRSVPVRLRHGHRSRQVAIMGLQHAPQLNRVIDASLQPVDL
ncbi:MAG: ABC transporter permease, partial [Acidobacteriota bacterium]